MFNVYILKNTRSGRHYIGSTNNLERRITEHSRGQTKSTKQKGSWKLIYKEVYTDIIEARKRERLIKSYKGGNGFRKLLADATRG